MAVPDSSKRLEEAKKQAKSSPAEAEVTYKDVLSNGPGTSDATARDYENALMSLGELYRDQKKPEELSELVRTTRSELANLPKAKTAKIGRHYHSLYVFCGRGTNANVIVLLNSATTPRPLRPHT